MTKRASTSIFSTSINSEVNALKAFGDIPAAYGTLIDIGVDQFSTSMMMFNGTDVDIIIRYQETSQTETIPAGLGWAKYPFTHNGEIQYKYVSGAPTSGYFLIKSW